MHVKSHHTESAVMVARAWGKRGMGSRVSVWEDDESAEDRWWSRLHVNLVQVDYAL